MGCARFLRHAAALAALVCVAPATGQKATGCVTSGTFTDCRSTVPRPAAKAAKITQDTQDLAPPYQPPQREQSQVAQPTRAPLNVKELDAPHSIALETGNDLLSTCSADNAQSGTACMSYIRGLSDGFSDALDLAKQPQAFCPLPGVTFGQIRDVVTKWLRDNPDKRAYRSDVLIVASLHDAFPCSK